MNWRRDSEKEARCSSLEPSRLGNLRRYVHAVSCVTSWARQKNRRLQDCSQSTRLPMKHFKPAHFRQIPIQQDNFGKGSIGFLFPKQRPKSLLAVVRDRKLPFDVACSFAKRPLYQ